MTRNERDALLRQYAAGELTWTSLRGRGAESYRDVLVGLGKLGLRPLMAPMALPERVTALSTGDLLYELEAAGRIHSSDRILDVAAEKQRNVERQRQPSADDAARQALRRQLLHSPE